MINNLGHKGRAALERVLSSTPINPGRIGE